MAVYFSLLEAADTDFPRYIPVLLSPRLGPFPQHFSPDVQLHFSTSFGSWAHQTSLSPKKAVVKIMVGRALHITKKVVSLF